MNKLIILGAIVAILLSTTTGFSQDSAKDEDQPTPPIKYEFPNAEERFKRFVKKSIGPRALAGAGISTTFQQISNTPPEWEKTGSGFARRFASNVGENVIEEATEYALSEAFRQDAAYRKCECRGFGKRSFHALKSGFTARDRNGQTVFSPGKVAAPFVGSVTATKAWYPERYTVKDGLRRGGYGLAFNVGFNLVREFVF